MNTIAEKPKKDFISYEMLCPYRNIETERCMAAISTMSLGPMTRLTYCDTENFDNCPVFLAKVLRRQYL
jgi:hypothetical protein